MKAFRLLDAQRAELCDVPVPNPGPGEVLVKVAGAGLCHSDLHLMHSPMAPSRPYTLGHETAGWVAELGAGVSGLAVDQPVVVHGAWGCGHCKNCQLDLEQHCLVQPVMQHASGLGCDGGLAEYLLVPAARHLVPLGSLDPRTSAPIDDAALTPYHAMKRWQHLLTPDATAVVIGVGGLGHMAIQLLRATTAVRVVAVDQLESKLELAGRLGADVAVRAGERAADEIRDALGGRGAQLVLDLVGSDDTLALASRIVEPLSHISLVGAALGSLSLSFLSPPIECSVSTTFWGTVGELRELVALAESGRIEIHAETFPLADVVKYYERLEAGDVEGRAVAQP